MLSGYTGGGYPSIAVGIRASGMLVGDGKNDYIYPYEEFFNRLELLRGVWER